MSPSSGTNIDGRFCMSMCCSSAGADSRIDEEHRLPRPGLPSPLSFLSSLLLADAAAISLTRGDRTSELSDSPRAAAECLGAENMASL